MLVDKLSITRKRANRSDLSVLTTGSLILLLASVPVTSIAGYTTFKPTLRVESLYDDNIDLDAQNQDAVWRTTSTVRGKASYLTEKTTVSGDFKWENYSYAGAGDVENRDDLTFLLLANHRDELNYWEFKGLAIEDSTRKEIIGFEAGDAGADTGRVRDDITRNRIYLTPSYTRKLSEFSKLEFRYKYSDLQYKNVRNTGLVDSFNHNLTATYYRAINDRYQLQPNFAANRFESEDNDINNYYVANLGVEQKFSNNLTLFAQVGGFFYQAETPEINKNSTDFLLEFSGNYNHEQLNIEFTAERIMGPGDFGNVITRDQLTLALGDQLSPEWEYQLKARYYRNRSIIKAITDSNRRRTALRASLIWHISEALNLDIGYRLRNEKENRLAEADSNAVFLSVSYKGDFTM